MDMKKVFVVLFIVLALLTAGCTSHAGKGVNAMVPKTLKVSSVFRNGGYIPGKFTCDGEDVNPPIFIDNVSENAKSLVIIVDDPDAPGGTFTHWIAWNIPPVGEVPGGIAKEGIVEEPIHILQGVNDFGKIGYNGPCPPKGKPHHYHFKIYALDITLDLKPGSSRKELERAMEGHIVQWGELVGLYERK